jgi:hypothetical protein
MTLVTFSMAKAEKVFKKDCCGQRNKLKNKPLSFYNKNQFKTHK